MSDCIGSALPYHISSIIVQGRNGDDCDEMDDKDLVRFSLIPWGPITNMSIIWRFWIWHLSYPGCKSEF